MSRGWDYKPGDWLVICDICSRKIKATESRERWDGLRVCKEDWEPRHPMDFIKTKQDKISVPFTRPRPPDVFITLYSACYYLVEDYLEENVSYFIEPDTCLIEFDDYMIILYTTDDAGYVLP